MDIQVLFFASVRDLVGEQAQTVSVPDGATVGDLLSELAGRHPRFGEMAESLMVSVNQDYVERDGVLTDGDEVALIPPVSGG